MNITDISRSHLKLALRYCHETFGHSKYHAKLPKVRIDPSLEEWGHYDSGTNQINLNLKKHKSYIDVLDTFIHEYTHYIQNLNKWKPVYHKKFGYDLSPQELEAEHAALKHKWLAKKYIRENLKIEGQL